MKLPRSVEGCGWAFLVPRVVVLRRWFNFKRVFDPSVKMVVGQKSCGTLLEPPEPARSAQG